jgi:hypothetical protein
MEWIKFNPHFPDGETKAPERDWNSALAASLLGFSHGCWEEGENQGSSEAFPSPQVLRQWGSSCATPVQWRGDHFSVTLSFFCCEVGCWGSKSCVGETGGFASIRWSGVQSLWEL